LFDVAPPVEFCGATFCSPFLTWTFFFPFVDDFFPVPPNPGPGASEPPSSPPRLLRMKPSQSFFRDQSELCTSAAVVDPCACFPLWERINSYLCNEYISGVSIIHKTCPAFYCTSRPSGPLFFFPVPFYKLLTRPLLGHVCLVLAHLPSQGIILFSVPQRLTTASFYSSDMERSLLFRSYPC